MKTIITILMMAMMLLVACDVPQGTLNHNITTDNATTCEADCNLLYNNNSCGKYRYEWFKNETFQTCNCSVNSCLR